MQHGVGHGSTRPQGHGVIGIGGDALEAVNHQLFQIFDLFAFEEESGGNQLFAPLSQQSLAVRGRLPGGRAGQRLNRYASFGCSVSVESPRQVPELGGAVNERSHLVFVEVHIGESGKDRLDGEGINLRVCRAQLTGAMRILADALDGMDQQILKRCGVLVLAADSDGLAALALRCLFTLVAKHGESPPG